MLTVTADDIRILAKSGAHTPVLAVVDGHLVVAPADEIPEDEVVYTQVQLIDEYGPDVTDIEAELAAGALTAELAGVDDQDDQLDDQLHDVNDPTSTARGSFGAERTASPRQASEPSRDRREPLI